MPQKVRNRQRNCNQIQAIQCSARSILGKALVPLLHPPFPQGQRLKRGAFAGIMGSDEYNRITQLDGDVFETLETPNSQPREHECLSYHPLDKSTKYKPHLYW